MSLKDDWAIKFQKRLLKNNGFTIISSDCWGGELYRHFDLVSRTPFVGTLLMAPCFIKMLKNLKFYMDAELSFIPHSKYEERNIDRKERNKSYPIGLLNNEVEVHFFHYKSEKEAFIVWNKLKEWINWDDLYIKFDGSKDGCTPELLKEFASLPFKNKLCVGKEEFKDISSSVSFGNWIVDGAKMYRISLEKVNVINWLNGGDWRETGFFYKAFYNLFIRKNKNFL